MTTVSTKSRRIIKVVSRRRREKYIKQNSYVAVSWMPGDGLLMC